MPESSKFAWKKLADLKQYKIGLVAGYVYNDGFDQMIDNNQIDHVFFPDDKTMIESMNTNLADAYVVEESVYNYIIDNHAQADKYRSEVKISEQYLSDEPIYIAFPKTSRGEKIRNLIDKELKYHNIDKIYTDYNSQLREEHDKK